jgi:RNA polymerase sigma-70 factor (ECF subfamily)
VSGVGDRPTGDRRADSERDTRLILAVAQGDRQAFRLLMGHHAKPSLNLARRLLGSVEDADEVIQEAFLRVWQFAPNWRPDGEARFSTWLYRIVFNLCMDRRRRPAFRALDEMEIEPTVEADGPARTTEEWNRILVAKAIATLPLRQRTAVALYYFGEVSAAEAARIMGVSLPAMESLLVRSRRSIRQFLVDQGVTEIGDIL